MAAPDHADRLLRSVDDIDEDEFLRAYKRAHARLDRFDKLAKKFGDALDEDCLAGIARITLAAAADITRWETIRDHRKNWQHTESQEQ